jgi:hypothetical protein
MMPLVYDIDLLPEAALSSEEGMIEFRGALRHFNVEPLEIGSNNGGSLLKLGFRVGPASPSSDVLFEDRISLEAIQLEPSVSYPFCIRLPQAIQPF